MAHRAGAGAGAGVGSGPIQTLAIPIERVQLRAAVRLTVWFDNEQSFTIPPEIVGEFMIEIVSTCDDSIVTRFRKKTESETCRLSEFIEAIKRSVSQRWAEVLNHRYSGCSRIDFGPNFDCQSWLLQQNWTISQNAELFIDDAWIPCQRGHRWDPFFDYEMFVTNCRGYDSDYHGCYHNGNAHAGGRRAIQGLSSDSDRSASSHARKSSDSPHRGTLRPCAAGYVFVFKFSIQVHTLVVFSCEHQSLVQAVTATPMMEMHV